MFDITFFSNIFYFKSGWKIYFTSVIRRAAVRHIVSFFFFRWSQGFVWFWLSAFTPPSSENGTWNTRVFTRRPAGRTMTRLRFYRSEVAHNFCHPPPTQLQNAPRHDGCLFVNPSHIPRVHMRTRQTRRHGRGRLNFYLQTSGTPRCIVSTPIRRRRHDLQHSLPESRFRVERFSSKTSIRDSHLLGHKTRDVGYFHIVRMRLEKKISFLYTKAPFAGG